MKNILAFILAVVLTVFLIPMVIGGVGGKDGLTDTEIPEGEGDAVTSGSFTEPFNITVYETSSDKLFEIELEEYLVGVLAGEMPPTYHAEALKAQAVAARSYILSKIADYFGGNRPEEHRGAMVCTDFAHCKSWRDIAEVKTSWDSRFAADYEAKIRDAVDATCGEYMTYDNKVVKAYFYAISGGRTENVEEVWGTSLPYLKSVPSRGDIGADGFESMSTYPKDLFVQKLKNAKEGVEISELDECVGEVTRTQGGGISRIQIGGVEFGGDEIRDIFDLRSTNFEILFDGDKVTFRVKGYGHGVGMSQNGANAMAQEGRNYTQILKHYYSGVSMVNLYKKA